MIAMGLCSLDLPTLLALTQVERNGDLFSFFFVLLICHIGGNSLSITENSAFSTFEGRSRSVWVGPV